MFSLRDSKKKFVLIFLGKVWDEGKLINSANVVHICGLDLVKFFSKISQVALLRKNNLGFSLSSKIYRNYCEYTARHHLSLVFGKTLPALVCVLSVLNSRYGEFRWWQHCWQARWQKYLKYFNNAKAITITWATAGPNDNEFLLNVVVSSLQQVSTTDSQRARHPGKLIAMNAQACIHIIHNNNKTW